MEQLSLKNIAGNACWELKSRMRCVSVGGFLPLRSAEVTNLHHLLFETLPGFTWINTGSVILGAVYMFVFAWFFSWLPYAVILFCPLTHFFMHKNHGRGGH